MDKLDFKEMEIAYLKNIESLCPIFPNNKVWHLRGFEAGWKSAREKYNSSRLVLGNNETIILTDEQTKNIEKVFIKSNSKKLTNSNLLITNLINDLIKSVYDGFNELNQYYNGGEEELLEHLDSWMNEHNDLIDQLNKTWTK